MITGEKTIASNSLFVEKTKVSEKALNIGLFEGVSAFYNVDHTVLYTEGITRPDLAVEHLNIAQHIGALMDIQFLKHLQGRDDFKEIDRVVDILPLRGALALVPEENTLTSLNTEENSEAYTILPIGVKRDGSQAKIYFPSKDTLASRLAQDSTRTIYRIKDFGIATGGTSVELVKTIMSLVEQGINPDQIVIQGAAGTLLAQERIKSEPGFEGINVMFAVEGEMPIERQAKELLNRSDNTLDFLSLVALVEDKIKRAGDGKVDSKMYYLDRIRQVDTVPFADTNPFVGGEISASDWGDESFTSMRSENFVKDFIQMLRKVLRDNGQELSETAAADLHSHYVSTLVKEVA